MNTGEILLFNKPYRWTSFDVVRKIKYAHQSKLKIGHAGTLDPLATGLLIVCTGKMTKRISEIQDAEKEYTGSFCLGATTPSNDLETQPDNTFETNHITEVMIYDTAKRFIGEQLQTPPAHSAVKINGRRAYKLARAGKEVKPEPKKIIIKEFEITSIEMPQVFFRVVCGKGTYIRSLAFDFGKELGSGAHLSSLIRTRIGNYLLADAQNPENFSCAVKEEIS